MAVEREGATEGARVAARIKLATQLVADTERAREKMMDLDGPGIKYRIQQQVFRLVPAG